MIDFETNVKEALAALKNKKEDQISVYGRNKNIETLKHFTMCGEVNQVG